MDGVGALDECNIGKSEFVREHGNESCGALSVWIQVATEKNLLAEDAGLSDLSAKPVCDTRHYFGYIVWNVNGKERERRDADKVDVNSNGIAAVFVDSTDVRRKVLAVKYADPRSLRAFAVVAPFATPLTREFAIETLTSARLFQQLGFRKDCEVGVD